MWYPNSAGEFLVQLDEVDREIFLSGVEETYGFISGDETATDDDLFVYPDYDEEDSPCEGELWNQLEGSQRFVLLAELTQAIVQPDRSPPKKFTVYHQSALWMIVDNLCGTVSCEIDHDDPPEFRQKIHSVWTSLTNPPFDLSPEDQSHEKFHAAISYLYFDRFLEDLSPTDELPSLPTPAEAQTARQYLDCTAQFGDLGPESRSLWRLSLMVCDAASWDYGKDTSGHLSPSLRFRIRGNRLYVIPFDGLDIDVVFDAHIDVGKVLSCLSNVAACEWSQGDLLVRGDFEGQLCEIIFWSTTIGTFVEEHGGDWRQP